MRGDGATGRRPDAGLGDHVQCFNLWAENGIVHGDDVESFPAEFIQVFFFPGM